MDNFWRMITTGFIWLMSCGLGIAAVMQSGTGDEWIVIPVLIAALLATGFIWISEALAVTAKARAESRYRLVHGESERGKSKRNAGSESDKMALLMELMDDDERADFKDMLKRRVLQDARLSADGEFFAPSTLESLMTEEDDYHSTRR